MRNLVQITTEAPFASENIATFYSNFNQDDEFVVTSGLAVVESYANSTYSYFGGGAIKVDFSDTDLVSFFARLEQMKTVAKNTGKHIFSIALFKENGTSIVDFGVNIFVNGVLSADNELQVQKTKLGWEVFTQIIELEKDDEVDFVFNAKSNEGGFDNLWIDRFSLEFDINNVGIPYIYNEAKEIPFERVVEIDVPSIASNTGATITAVVEGVRLGDVLAMRYPIELINLGIVVGQPIVSDINEVKFYLYHHGGASVNPASGTFKFKKV